MKRIRDKEEYRRAYAVKQKMEGVSYRNIAKDIGVNYRNVYNWIDNYRKFGLDSIRNRRKNGGRRAVISTTKKRDDKRHCAEQIIQGIWLFENTWSIRLLATYLSSLLVMNVSRSQTWRIIHDLGIVYKQPKLELEKEKDDDYEEKKEKIDR